MIKSNLISAGNSAFALRLIIGWTYFSAFWRRLVLENKLDPEVAGYIGEKFNHFLPHALFIKEPIEFLLLNPELLWWVMAIFTIVEGLTGLLFMFGLYTRTMSLIVMNLALGILLSAGWIGTTCLDEWQIGILGLAGGMTLFFTGGGEYSLDHKFGINELKFKIYSWMNNQKFALISSLLILFTALGTNQHFHGGVWGTLHNKSVSPELSITNLTNSEEEVSFNVMRTHGADVYGSFVHKVEILDLNTKAIVYSLQTDEIKKSDFRIENHYIAKIKHSEFALVIPLGASAKITLQPKIRIPKDFVLRLTDISGKSWSISPIDQDIMENKAFLKEIKESKIVIDVRTKEEFKQGHLSNAINIPVESIKNEITKVQEIIKRNPNSKVLVHCKTGIRAQEASQILKDNGIETINIGSYQQLSN